MESFNIRPIDYASVKNGTYIIINGRPCKCVNFSHSKTGKHGSMKVKVVGIDVLTNKKYESMEAGHILTKQFDIVRTTAQLISLDDETLTCLDENFNQISYQFSKSSPTYDEVKKHITSLSETEVYISILCAPVEKSKDEYNLEYIIENCKCA